MPFFSSEMTVVLW